MAQGVPGVSRGFAAWGGASRRRGCAVHGPRGSRFVKPARGAFKRRVRFAGFVGPDDEESSLAEHEESSLASAGANASLLPDAALDAAAAQIRSLAVSDEAFDRARFERVVERIRRPVADRLGRLVVVDAELPRHLRALRAYMLLGRAATFTSASSRRRGAPTPRRRARPPPRRTSRCPSRRPPRSLPPRTTRKSSRAGSGSGWAHRTARTPEDAEEEAFSKKNASDFFADANRSRRRVPAYDAWDSLSPEYAVPWPLGLLLTRDALRRYDEMFKYLLRLRRAARALDEAWVALRRVAAGAATTTPGALRAPRRSAGAAAPEVSGDHGRGNHGTERGGGVRARAAGRGVLGAELAHVPADGRRRGAVPRDDGFDGRDDEGRERGGFRRGAARAPRVPGGAGRAEFPGPALGDAVGGGDAGDGPGGLRCDRDASAGRVAGPGRVFSQRKAGGGDGTRAREAFDATSRDLYDTLRSDRLAGDPKAPYLRRLLLRLNFNGFMGDKADAARRREKVAGPTGPPVPDAHRIRDPGSGFGVSENAAASSAFAPSDPTSLGSSGRRGWGASDPPTPGRP